MTTTSNSLRRRLSLVALMLLLPAPKVSSLHCQFLHTSLADLLAPLRLDDFDDFQSAPTPVVAAPSAHQNVFDLLKANPPPSAAPPRSSFPAAPAAPSYQQAIPGYAPMQAQPRPPMQQQQSSFYSSASSRTTPTPAASKPASDFSDLFSSFGGAASTPSSSGQQGGAGPKLTMGELAAQARQKQLFGAAGSGAGQQAQNGGGWDSLL